VGGRQRRWRLAERDAPDAIVDAVDELHGRCRSCSMPGPAPWLGRR
jgi:hypothetical protein